MGKLIALGLFLVGAALMLRPLGGVSSPGWVIRPPTVIERQGTTTLLALGLDRRGTEIARTDAIVLVHFGPAGEPTGLLSIPRDLWVNIPGRGEDRINTAYTWGDLDDGAGVALARRTVEESFGIRVDRVAVVDFACFETAIDAIGGVPVQVPDRLVDEAYPAADGGTRVVVFDPGPQVLSGERALQFVRTRSADSDFGRMRRQQQVVSAFAGAVGEPSRALRLAGSLGRRCTGFGSDLSPIDIMTLGALATTGRELKLRMINESMVSQTTLPTGAQVLLPDWDRIRPAVAEIIPGRGR